MINVSGGFLSVISLVAMHEQGEISCKPGVRAPLNLLFLVIPHSFLNIIARLVPEHSTFPQLVSFVHEIKQVFARSCLLYRPHRIIRKIIVDQDGDKPINAEAQGHLVSAKSRSTVFTHATHRLFILPPKNIALNVLNADSIQLLVFNTPSRVAPTSGRPISDHISKVDGDD